MGRLSTPPKNSTQLKLLLRTYRRLQLPRLDWMASSHLQIRQTIQEYQQLVSFMPTSCLWVSFACPFCSNHIGKHSNQIPTPYRPLQLSRLDWMASSHLQIRQTAQEYQQLVSFILTSCLWCPLLALFVKLYWQALNSNSNSVLLPLVAQIGLDGLLSSSNQIDHTRVLAISQFYAKQGRAGQISIIVAHGFLCLPFFQSCSQ